MRKNLQRPIIIPENKGDNSGKIQQPAEKQLDQNANISRQTELHSSPSLMAQLS